MLKVVNDAVYWLLSSGTLAAVVAFLWKYLKPLLEQKAQHASTAQSKEAWGLLEAVARTAVDSLVSNNNLSGKEKHKVATAQVQQVMNDQGIKVDNSTASTAVQKAYELSPLTPTVEPKPQAVKKPDPAPVVPNNRANVVNPEMKEGLQ